MIADDFNDEDPSYDDYDYATDPEVLTQGGFCLWMLEPSEPQPDCTWREPTPRERFWAWACRFTADTTDIPF